MKKLFMVIFILSYALSLSAKRVALLSDIDKPMNLKVDDNYIYIVNDNRVFIYSRHDFKLLKKLGKSGDGPGEFRPYSNVMKLPLFVDVQSDEILVTSDERISVFDKFFKFKEDLNIPPQIGFAYKSGRNLICSNYVFERGPIFTEYIILFSGDGLKYIKQIYKTRKGGSRLKPLNPRKKQDYNVTPHCFDYQIFKDKIYIGDSSKGYYFAVFDLDGNKLHEIQKEEAKLPVTEEYRKSAISRFKALEKRKERLKIINPIVPEFLPSFKSFRIADDRIYVFSYKRVGQEVEVSILDLNGVQIGVTSLPVNRFYSVIGNKYYYLNKNKDREWELVVEPIKLNESK